MARSHSRETAKRELIGRATVRRVNPFGFPVFVMRQEGRPIARLGRFSWVSVYLGFGQRIDLDDGTEWRIRSTENSGVISPVILNADKQKVATGFVGHSGYRINGKDFVYDLVSAEGHTRWRRPNDWILRDVEDVVANITRIPAGVTTTQPVPMAAVLLALALTHIGIPGENMPKMAALEWTKP